MFLCTDYPNIPLLIFRVHYDGHSEPIHWSARPNHYLAIMPNDSDPYLVIDKTIVRDTGEYRYIHGSLIISKHNFTLDAI